MLLTYIGIDKINFLQFEDDTKNRIKLLYHQRYNNDFLMTGKDTSYLGFKEIISQAVNRLNISDKDVKVIVESQVINYKKIEPRIPFNFKVNKYIKNKILKDKKTEDHIFTYFVNKNINFKTRKDPRECYFSVISRQMYDELKITFEEQGLRVLSIEPFLSTMADFFIDETYKQFKDNDKNIILMRKNNFLYVFIIEDDQLVLFDKYLIEYSFDKSLKIKYNNIMNIINKIKEIISYRIGSNYNVLYFPLKEEDREVFKKEFEKNTSLKLFELKVPVILNDITIQELHKYIEVAALYKKTVIKTV